ncbi:glycoside hydrolase domain-containing protein [Kutzneria buriramensis]|uniref:Putative peptidoglycan binding protein n=1 Tax=Kutzneria buriramensis TaxID=1045776 RepID=A0A3E0G7Q1_9PSEU|nr:glycoside hydrolase domain-containing protein [Kutzneria buriramensis]REH17985.1 putative peptidoglycan binding protein [Kutzneria buriramensis]
MNVEVLQAQQWVNATYGGVVGYNSCPEDGVAGATTLYSLTRALQHELGITALSDNFGPMTLGALAQRGGVPLTESNQNIVKILQSACACKGYPAGGLSGTFGQRTRFAVGAMMSDAGVGALGSGVAPKVMKALLSMDSYVLVAGGNAAVRSVQQWFNGRYTTRRDFFVLACDGVVSRTVVQATILAIQFELGLTDDQATGVFGPMTRAGLTAHSLSVGASGVWVSLFSAAMVLGASGSFAATYTEELVCAVRRFQEFSALPVTGQADFATWAQLLVSTGDADRPATACDCVTTITPARAQALRTAGYRVVGRYLDQRGTTLDKKIKPGELQTIFGAGLKVLPISQYDGSEASYFTHDQGVRDASDAHTAAAGYGFKAGTVIYFAVDYDAVQDEIDTAIEPYFRGVIEGLAAKGGRYVHGVYGSRDVCAQVSERTGARWSFVSDMSTGYGGNMGFPLPANWAFSQIQTLTVGSGDGQIEIDKDVQRPGADPGVSSVQTTQGGSW